MANQLAQSPAVIDTAGATIFFPKGCKVKHMEWTNYLAGATLIVNNGLGNLIWSPTAANDLSEVRTAAIGWIDTGFQVPTLSSGKLLVFFE